jgi:hypothetical protein
MLTWDFDIRFCLGFRISIFECYSDDWKSTFGAGCVFTTNLSPRYNHWGRIFRSKHSGQTLCENIVAVFIVI